MSLPGVGRSRHSLRRNVAFNTKQERREGIRNWYAMIYASRSQA
jgi:hypothetical protein